MLLVPGCIEPETASTFVTQQPDPRSCVNPGGRRLEPGPTTRAGAAMERHPCHVWRDLGDFDPVVGVARNLRDSRHIRLALRTAIGPDLPTPRRVGMQRTIRARMGLALRLRLGLTVRLHRL